MHTIYFWTSIGAVTAAVLLAISYIIGFAYTAGSWSFHWIKKQLKLIREEADESGEDTA